MKGLRNLSVLGIIVAIIFLILAATGAIHWPILLVLLPFLPAVLLVIIYGSILFVLILGVVIAAAAATFAKGGKQ